MVAGSLGTMRYASSSAVVVNSRQVDEGGLYKQLSYAEM